LKAQYVLLNVDKSILEGAADTSSVLYQLGSIFLFLQVAIKIMYVDLGATLVRKLAKYIPNEISNMERGFGHPNVVGLTKRCCIKQNFRNFLCPGRLCQFVRLCQFKGE